MEQLDALVFGHGRLVVLIRIPDREDDELFSVPQLLNAEISLVPAADAEISARGGAFHNDLVVKRGGLGRFVPEVDGASGFLLLGGGETGREDDEGPDRGFKKLFHR